MDVSLCSRQLHNHGSALNKFLGVDKTFWYGRYSFTLFVVCFKKSNELSQQTDLDVVDLL